MADKQLSPESGRLKELRKTLNLRAVDIAEVLDITRSGYYQLEDGTIQLSQRHLKALKESFGFNSEYILHGTGQKITPKLDNQVNDHLESYNKGFRNILAPIPVNAGISMEYTQEWLDQNPQQFIVSGILGPTVTFQVTGDSMVPYINDCEYIVTQKVADKNILKPKMVLVIVTIDGIFLKETEFTPDRKAILRSFNDDYMPITIPQQDIKEVYLPVKRLLGA